MADEINTSPQIPSEQPVKSAPVKQNKKLLIVVGLVICALVAGVVIKLLLNSSSNKKKQPAPTTAIAKQRPPTLAEQADKINFQGDYAGSQKFLDDHISQLSDAKEKGALYEEKSLLAFNTKKYEDSLKFAQTAESLNPTGISASLISNAAEATGDKALAVQYIRKRLERNTKTMTEDDKAYYENKIKQLGG